MAYLKKKKYAKISSLAFYAIHWKLPKKLGSENALFWKQKCPAYNFCWDSVLFGNMMALYYLVLLIYNYFYQLCAVNITYYFEKIYFAYVNINNLLVLLVLDYHFLFYFIFM